MFSEKPKYVFTIKLAGVAIEVHGFYLRTKKFFREYLTDEPGEFSVSLEMGDIREERMLAAQQRKREGHGLSYYLERYFYSDSNYEPIALCRKIMSGLLERNVLLFHGAAVAVEGKAYLFTAKSGVGKTTHCRLWLKNVPGCHILNGDKPLLLFKDNRVYACGSPWMGKEKYGVNEILPLEGVCLLERDRNNHIEPIRLKNSLMTLLQQCHVTEGKGNLAKVTSLIKQLECCRVYRLGCNMRAEAARVAYSGMICNQDKKDKGGNNVGTNDAEG